MTKKQREEVEFLSMLSKQNITEEHIKYFINFTSKWIWEKADMYYQTNPLILEKRKFDITVKMWIEDLREWLLFYRDLEEDFNNHPYIIRCLNTIRKTITPLHTYDWLLSLAILWYMNSKFNF